MKVAVICIRPQLGEDHLESLVRLEIIRGSVENPSITGDGMRNISVVRPNNLCPHFDRQRCRIKGILSVFRNNLHIGNRYRREQWCWAGLCGRSWAWLS